MAPVSLWLLLCGTAAAAAVVASAGAGGKLFVSSPGSSASGRVARSLGGGGIHVGGGGVPAAHLVHQVPAARLRKIQRHNPILSPYHPNHYDNLVLAAAAKTLSLSPAELGGDPTGQRDSTAAVQAAVETCYQQQASHDPKGTAAGGGNCEVNLGGEYLISSPIVTPSFENFIFGYGSLVAAANWSAPTGAGQNFLIVGKAGQRGHYYPELYLDGQHLAGGLAINNSCAMTVGPGSVIQVRRSGPTSLSR